MQDEQDQKLVDVERVQQALKRNIEESTRLIDQAQEAIQRFRDAEAHQEPQTPLTRAG